MTGPGRPRIIPDELILETARRIYREELHLGSTHKIAAAIRLPSQAPGIPQATLFQRFNNADDLFFSAMSPRPIENIVVLLRPISEQINQETIRQASQALLNGPFDQNHILDNLLFLTKAGFRDRTERIELLQLIQQVTTIWEPLAGQLRLPPGEAAQIFISMIFTAAFVQYVTDEEPDVELLVQRLTGAILA